MSEPREARRDVLKLAAAAALGAAGAAGAAAFSAPRMQSPQRSRSVGDFDVVAYGADSSGTRDSTASIQRAIEDAARIRGGIVLFPAGTYVCGGPLVADRSIGVQQIGRAHV